MNRGLWEALFYFLKMLPLISKRSITIVAQRAWAPEETCLQWWNGSQAVNFSTYTLLFG